MSKKNNSKISAVISVYNEEKNIKDCLDSVKWADEIVVVDNSSTDKTATVARRFTSKVFKRPNYKMLNTNKNYGFRKATGEWILNLDGDERVNKKLKEEILQAASSQQPAASGYLIPRKNIVFGKWIQHGIWWPDYQLRLFKKGKGRFACKHVHEKMEVKGEVAGLKSPLVHYNYTSVSQFVRKMNDIYTDNEAENFIKEGKKIFWYDAIRMPANDFLANFFARGSYKDGLHGLVLSMLQAFYALLVFCKVWEKQDFWKYDNSHFLVQVKKETNKSYKDFGFWFRKTSFKGFLKKLFS